MRDLFRRTRCSITPRFDWISPKFEALNAGVGAHDLRNADRLTELAKSRTPRVEMAFGRPDPFWDALGNDRNLEDFYRIDAVFVARSKPSALRSAVAARVEAIGRCGGFINSG